MDRYRNFDPCHQFEIPEETNKPVMKKENLLRMADYIETIPQHDFNMELYRLIGSEYHKCNSVGCIIGHCTFLDEEENLPRWHDGEINFYDWSEQFTGIEFLSDSWRYLFCGDWVKTDNTPTGAAKRIRYFVEHGLPEDWEEQIVGTAPLIYMNDER